MSNTWLMLDVSFLAHRALHSTGNLSYQGEVTGVLYGILRDVFALREHFGADHVVWTFDSPKKGGVREALCPTYNDKRKNARKTPEQIEQTKQLHKQLRRLRRRLLPKVVRNILWYQGYEADDCIAWAVNSIPKEDTAIIISADKDLYQLIRNKGPRVLFYNPNKMEVIDRKTFRKMYMGLSPKRWAVVKAMAGCKTDSIDGIKGIGEATAVKYLMKKLKPESVAYKNIIKNDKILKKNLPLVALPFDNKTASDDVISVIPDPPRSHKKWSQLFRKLGIKSL